MFQFYQLGPRIFFPVRPVLYLSYIITKQRWGYLCLLFRCACTLQVLRSLLSSPACNTVLNQVHMPTRRWSLFLLLYFKISLCWTLVYRAFAKPNVRSTQISLNVIATSKGLSSSVHRQPWHIVLKGVLAQGVSSDCTQCYSCTAWP